VQLTFRAKLLLILVTASLSLVAVIAGSTLIGLQQVRDLGDVEGRLIPRLELGPRIETEFEHLRQGMQDAVAAQDAAALEGLGATRIQIFELIATAGPALDPAAAARLRWAIQDYYEQAEAVSRRLIAGETGEVLVDDIARMQERQRRARDVIRKTTQLDRNELASGFAAVRNATQRADRFRLVIGLCGLALLIGLSLWIARGVFRVLENISSGFARFATGDFSGEIPVTSTDELGGIAREANQMAASLRRLAELRDRSDWLKTGQVGLFDEIRGELELKSVAERALAFLGRRVRARAGAIYLSDDDGVLQLSAGHAFSERAEELETELAALPAKSFKPGEGLVGQAAQADELLVVDDVPKGYLKVRSGLGESDAHSLLFLPLVHLGKTLGVAELALFGACTDEVRELLISIRESLVIALEAAKARSALRELLEDAQQLAERLATQEEELRVNNHELRSQQEELQAANEALEAQRVELRAQNTELEDARRRVQQKAEELAKVSSYKSQFLANMSHELRTPLNSMLLLSQLLSENEGRNLSAKQVLHCKTIHSAGEDLLALINQVLDLAKIEAGRQDVELGSVALSDFVDYSRRLFEPMAIDKGITLRTEIAPDMPEAMTTDRQRVERILTNLIGNAIKFTDRGEVSLRIGRPSAVAQSLYEGLGGTVAFVVSDTGIGIPSEAHDRIFAPFEQVESRSDRRYSGTGLGLAITRESAELLGGQLVLEKSSSSGSVFACYLPENARASPAKASGENGAEHSPLADDRAQLRASAPHLLLVEDDKVLAEQLVDIIHACGFQALVASTGDEGLRLAREHLPQGIILDVKLPGMDGWAVMDRLRAHPATRNIPVHFISGVDAARRGLALGAIGYLTKPATHGELTAAVRALAPLASEQRRVLIVEDSAHEAEALVELLGREGFTVTRAESAGQALHLISQEEFSCIIMDLGLPDMDGISLLEKLQAQAPKKYPPIIVHTGRALTKQEARLLESYADSVVMKGGSSGERLVEEVRLFVRHIEDRLPRARKSEIGDLLRSADVSLSGVKILVAEDDIRTVYALSALLAGKGAEVLVAETGREALDLLSKNPDVNAVLMDIMMPEMDGYEAMRRLRKEPRFEALPVIALTAKAMKGERERCLEAGASDYLTKPVDSERLLSTLRDWLEPLLDHAARRN
jgi:CheY-like chemotaxis protein/HAMP domain-containing protein